MGVDIFGKKDNFKSGHEIAVNKELWAEDVC